MKKLFITIIMLFVFVQFSLAQAVEAVAEPTNWWVWAIAVVYAAQELITRFIPDPKIIGLTGIIVNVLKVISDYLNRE